ncbi:MAG: helix-turn-helix transcriptional regulator [Fibrella sp.]|nr:helix-turn-helix transcriptional regulator [Armatimonadota bacterium]
MRTGFSRTAVVPETIALGDVPLIAVPVGEPPVIEWIGVGQHGRYAREDYRLPKSWCLHLYRWSGALRVAEIALPVSPGYVSIVPPNLPLSHFFRTGDPPAVHLSCGFRLSAAGSVPEVTLPMMGDSGESFGVLNIAWEKAIGVFGAAPRRAEVLLWDILWRLAEGAGGGIRGENEVESRRQPNAVRRTREAIELRLAEPLRVADLARSVDLSHNHLTRLFHAATGKTVVAYLRERRMDRAVRLLRHTTLPIKQVAAQVGLKDLHQFNKAIRAATGVSPRTIRSGLEGAGKE